MHVVPLDLMLQGWHQALGSARSYVRRLMSGARVSALCQKIGPGCRAQLDLILVNKSLQQADCAQLLQPHCHAQVVCGDFKRLKGIVLVDNSYFFLLKSYFLFY